ncbi:Retrovirus-related Pol polyprotein LINE-1 [Gossypium australe]|uniref:Retrovirus-related Pol polyprotein LINE-1 n=1 Tax=Gossypium australe TaxID=47621 RepID=A0A5B6U4I8_9ROSI|nr:Retrovirus-related Pol polyprotein LINE-1 [Gossypium australe]
MRSLNNIQNALEISTSNHLIKKEEEIRDELENVLDHIDLLWRQKARCDWLQLGDRNTNFFHSRTVKRMKFNHIMSLRVDNGDWCSDQNILQNKAVEFFGKLYGEWVKGVFDGKPIEAELNNTLIVLIPKKESPEDFSQFRPISLYSVLYKLVMKVIANRFKVIFSELISQEQAGFIAGRNIVDNIILAQEVIHSMRCNRKGWKWMAVKLDLEKAYDRVSWDFINASLSAAGIPLFLCNMIMSAISSSTMQVLWNRVPTQKFKPNRGIRQGCPLSPYLFVLCMEWLGHSIHSGIEVGTWDPIRLSRSGPPISHLFFADDLVIFCKAQIDQARLLKSILSLFCETSGHKISTRKSNIFYSNNTEVETLNQISQLFGFQEVQNLGKYLGVPLLHDRVTKNTLNFIVDKIRRNLNSWDARKLSFAGRIMLAQSVLLSIPTYFMQTMMIPKRVCDAIERLPRARGGLGLRQLNDQNSYFFMKIGDMVNIDGSWNLDLFRAWVPEEVINRITSIPPPHPDSGADRVIWARSITGIFSVRSAYWSLKEDTWHPHDEYWKLPWKYRGPQRVRMFLWLAFKQRLLTNSERARRGISYNSSYLTCGQGIEDLNHILRDCPTAKEIAGKWSHLVDLFGLIAWRIWKNRNMFIFQNISWLATEVVKVSSCWARQYESLQDVHKNTYQNSNTLNNSNGNWVYLSSDGAVSSKTETAAAEGMVRDYEGNWIMGFNSFLGVCSSTEAKLWDIMDGILILLNKGFRQITIASYNLEVVQNLSALNTGDFGIAVLRRTKRIIQSVGEWNIKYVPRNMNMVADCLAKLSLNWKSNLQVFTEAPKETLDLLQDDKANGYFL